ncbi:MAG TPA: O-antigen ligase family protein, partial [Candidatus Nitrosocosmicus sp.]|nr:O-antigen ligase family protein [Candidatus Nitrosocosmicus sp.]
MPSFFDKLFFTLYSILFFLTPLIIFHKTSELFEFNKLLFIYLLTIFIGCAWISKMILLKKFTWTRSLLDIPILIFVLSQILSTVFSIDSHTSIFGYYGRFNGGLLSIIAYIILYYAFVSNFKRKYLESLLLVSLGSAFIVFLWGIPARFGHDLTCLVFTGVFDNACWTDQFRPSERMFSTLGQPNWLGAYFSINFFISLYFVLKKRTKQTNSIIQYLTSVIYILPILLFIGILFTRSRSAIVATGICIILFFGHIILMSTYVKNFRAFILNYVKKIIIIFLLIGLSTLLIKTGIPKIDSILSLGFIHNSNQTSQKINPLTEQPTNVTESFDIRKIVWQGAAELGFKYPLFGTGVETFAYSYNLVRPIQHNQTSEWDYIYNKAHNEYLNFFATTGFVGLLSYLTFVIAVLYLLSRKIYESKHPINQLSKPSNINTVDTQESVFNENILLLCLLTSWVSILITNFFGFSTTTISLFFYLIPGILVVLYAKTNDEPITPISNMRYVSLIVPFIILIMGGYYLIKYFRADMHYSLGNSYYQIQDYSTAYEFLSKAESLKKDHVYEDRLSTVLTNLALVTVYQATENKDEAIENFTNAYKLSEYFSIQAIRSSSKNPYYHRNRAKNYYMFYSLTTDQNIFKTGIHSLHEAQKLAPTDAKNFYTEALYYILKLDEKDINTNEVKANIEKNLLKAISLKHDYRDA